MKWHWNKQRQSHVLYSYIKVAVTRKPAAVNFNVGHIFLYVTKCPDCHRKICSVYITDICSSANGHNSQVGSIPESYSGSPVF